MAAAMHGPGTGSLRVIHLRTPGAAGDGAASLWLREALTDEPVGCTDHEPFPARADLCIVGGGFTGLWTALHAKRLEPSADIVVLDARICGGAASGRNGGFVMTAWSKFGTLRKLCGEADALHYGRAADAAIGEIGAFCAENRIDAQFHRAGWLWAATNREQVDAWESTLNALAAAGEQPYRRLSREEVEEISGSPVHLAGVFEPAVATVHPGRLARGLRRTAIDAGVRIFEDTAASELDDGRPVVVHTSRGRLRAGSVVLAISAWAAELPDICRVLVGLASDVIATPPIRDRLAALGLETGIAISDSRRLVNYYRTTEDGRMVFGKGGGGLALGARIGPSFDRSEARALQTVHQFHRAYPSLWDVPAEAHWRGAVDYSLSGLPFVGPIGGQPNILAGVGFSGNGVGPSYVAGLALAEGALERDVSQVPEALRRLSAGRFPPEPLRCLGGTVVRAAMARKEAMEDSERQPDWLTRTLAALDPTSFVDRTTAAAVAPEAQAHVKPGSSAAG